MLHKTYFELVDAYLPYSVNPVISVVSMNDFEKVSLLYKDLKSKIRGVSVSLGFLETIDASSLLVSNINYVEVVFDKTAFIPLTFAKTKNCFTEAIIPVEICSNDLLRSLSNVDRVIVEFDDSIDQLPVVSRDLISNKFFPFTSGIPFCLAKIDQCVELFEKNEGNSLESCSGCKLQKYCKGPGEFEAKPIKEVSSDLLKFLEENEGIINRI